MCVCVCVCVCVSCSVGSDSVTPWTVVTRLLCPWNSPDKNTGLGCHFLLQGIFPTQGLNVGLPHGRQNLYHLSHQGSPGFAFEELLKKSDFEWFWGIHIDFMDFTGNIKYYVTCVLYSKEQILYLICSFSVNGQQDTDGTLKKVFYYGLDL